MWKQISKEEIKNVQIGTRVRVNGIETTLTDHYSERDYGFDVEYQPGLDYLTACIFHHGLWDQNNIVEVFEEKGYRLADGTRSTDYKVGDRFRVVHECDFNIDSIIELYYDDKTEIPKFKFVKGDDPNDGPILWEEWKNLERYVEGYRLADGTWSGDYKIGDKFLVIRNCFEFSQNSVVEFFDDDESDCPKFKLIEGSCGYNNAGGEPGAYTLWKDLERYVEDELEDPEDSVNEKGYQLADGTWSEDYKVGDKFRVVCESIMYPEIGEIVELLEDDGTEIPWFYNENHPHDVIQWGKLEHYVEDELEEPEDDITDEDDDILSKLNHIKVINNLDEDTLRGLVIYCISTGEDIADVIDQTLDGVVEAIGLDERMGEGVSR